MEFPISQWLGFLGLVLGAAVTLWPPSGVLKAVVFVAFIALGAGGYWTQGREQQSATTRANTQREADRQEDQNRIGTLQSELSNTRQQLNGAMVAINASVQRLGEPKPSPPQPELHLHDIYPESWGYPGGTGIPLDLDAAQPFPVTVGVNHPMAPCLMSPEALSNVQIAVTFPPELQVKDVDQRVWQKWTRGTRTQYVGNFRSVNIKDCGVLPIQLEFTPTKPGPAYLTYWVSGVGEKAGGLLPVERTIILNAKP